MTFGVNHAISLPVIPNSLVGDHAARWKTVDGLGQTLACIDGTVYLILQRGSVDYSVGVGEPGGAGEVKWRRRELTSRGISDLVKKIGNQGPAPSRDTRVVLG